MCKMCDNASMMCQALYKAKAVNTDNIESLVNNMVCDPNNKCCMYMECKTCKDKWVNIDKDLISILCKYQTMSKMSGRAISPNVFKLIV